MELKPVSAQEMSTLEDYATALAIGILSLKTLDQYHTSAISKGILPDDLIERAKVLIYDLQRARALYTLQMSETLELIPDDYEPKKVLEQWKNG